MRRDTFKFRQPAVDFETGRFQSGVAGISYRFLPLPTLAVFAVIVCWAERPLATVTFAGACIAGNQAFNYIMCRPGRLKVIWIESIQLLFTLIMISLVMHTAGRDGAGWLIAAPSTLGAVLCFSTRMTAVALPALLGVVLVNAVSIELPPARWVSILTSLGLLGGGLVMVISQFEAICERLAARQVELKDLLDVANRATRAKSDFLANMSHELRTPLNGIIGTLSLLQDGPLSTQERDLIQMADRSAAGLLRMICDILDFSRLDSGKLTLEQRAFDLRDELAHVEAELRASGACTGRQFDVIQTGPVPPLIVGDPLRISQIVRNFLSNAFKFTGPGGRVELRLGCPARSRRRALLQVSVSDTGIGMTADVRQRVLGRFEQADTSMRRRYGGTGLGLSICSELIELMGGQLTIDSQPGAGARFSFEIWVEVPDACEIVRPPSRTTERIDTANRSHLQAGLEATEPLHILLVEDMPDNQKVAELLLRRLGCQVTLANNGREAVELFEMGTYDCILMDCQMPEVDGYEATRRIRSIENAAGASPVRIVAFTAYAFPENRERCLTAGMDDFMTKPIEKASFQAFVAQLLEKRTPGARST